MVDLGFGYALRSTDAGESFSQMINLVTTHRDPRHIVAFINLREIACD